MSNSNAPAQGLPPPPLPLSTQTQQQQRQPSITGTPLLLQHQAPLHHSYTSRLVPQQQQIHSPHTLPSSSPAQFVQTQGANQGALQYPSPYSAGSSTILQHSADPNFFTAHPSPYSTNSVAGSYTSSETTDAMAQATMSRQSYPPLSSYHTPQSNSPASMHSPQHDATGRAYGMPPMQHQMYYPPTYPVHQTAQYHPHSAPPQHQLPSSTSLGVHYQQSIHPAYQQHAPQAHQQHGLMDSKMPQPSASRPLQSSTPLPLASHNNVAQPVQSPALQSHSSHAHHAQSQQGAPDMTLGSNSEPIQPAAPGPIPATTPQVVHQDQNGVQWIAFDYSRDRVKMQYTIRCDVESVDLKSLTDQFKTANCVYPRACEPADKYKGNRRQYETDCNSVGWALASLNVCLREKRGLIQRAVDSWRNSNRDHRLRSRRVRRQNKIEERKSRETSSTQPYPMEPHTSSSSSVLHGQHAAHQGMQVDPTRPGMPMPHHSVHHHQPTEGADPRGHVGASVDTSYSATQPQVPSNGLPSPSSVRHAQSFYPTYPTLPSVGASAMTAIQDGMAMPAPAPLPAMATPVHMVSVRNDKKHALDAEEEDLQSGRSIHGNLPAKKRPKFVIVTDTQRGEHIRVRVKANIDAVNVDEIPDTYLTSSATYPRSSQPRHMRSPSATSRGRVIWHDDEDDVEPDQRGSTLVPVTTLDGSETQLPVPKMTRARRHKEVLLNQLGHRMTWCQVRTFNGRKLFLQHALDFYRNKVHRELSGLAMRSEEAVDLPTHFEVRPGKRKLMDYQEQRRRKMRG